jgi:galactokinase
MTAKLISDTRRAFFDAYGREPDRLVLAPGRINILGEHIDYNDGFVLPAAINRYVCYAISAAPGTQAWLYAADLEQTHHFCLSDKVTPSSTQWANYILGVVAQLQKRNVLLQGFELAFSSNIPIGAGLSSSAAVECGFGCAVNGLFDLGISKLDLALIGQLAEHEFVGVKCGIMDQFACMFGKEGHVILLDCLSLRHTYHRAKMSGYSFVLLDSNVKHTLLTTGYNDRRRESDDGFMLVREAFPQVKTFRDITLSMLDQESGVLGDTLYKRCVFIVQEIARVHQAVAALKKSDFEMLGKLMQETHEGLSTKYEVSCAELDFLAANANNHAHCLGSRMMGGGFGGCTLNLVVAGQEEAFITAMSERYLERFGLLLTPYMVELSDGVNPIDDEI